MCLFINPAASSLSYRDYAIEAVLRGKRGQEKVKKSDDFLDTVHNKYGCHVVRSFGSVRPWRNAQLPVARDAARKTIQFLDRAWKRRI